MCVFVCVFSSFRDFLGSFLALGAGHRAAPFSVGLFVSRFLFVFSLLFGLFWVPLFGSGCWAPCCSFFRRAFCVRLCLCFLFFSGFFGFLFGSGCWAAVLLFFPSGFLCAFLFVFSLLFGLFWVPFWLWVLGAVLLLFPSGFLCAFLFVFSLLFVLFWVPGDHGGGEGAEAYDSGLGAKYSGRRSSVTADGGLTTAGGKG